METFKSSNNDKFFLCIFVCSSVSVRLRLHTFVCKNRLNNLTAAGVNLFPAGTINRWEVISSFIEQHCEGSQRSAKEVLFKAKDLQQNGTRSILPNLIT